MDKFQTSKLLASLSSHFFVCRYEVKDLGWSSCARRAGAGGRPRRAAPAQTQARAPRAPRRTARAAGSARPACAAPLYSTPPPSAPRIEGDMMTRLLGLEVCCLEKYKSI